MKIAQIIPLKMLWTQSYPMLLLSVFVVGCGQGDVHSLVAQLTSITFD